MDGDTQAKGNEAPGCGPPPVAASDAQGATRRHIFEMVRAEGRISRAGIARALGISPGTVSTLSADLIERGYLAEAAAGREATDSARGRPPVALTVVPEVHMVAGVKLSDREHTAILVDFAGRQIASVTREVTPGPVPVSVQMAALTDLIDALVAGPGLDRRDIAAVGLGVPGFVAHDSGFVHWSPVLDTQGVHLVSAAEAPLGLPVTIDNDANLCALAELWFGIGRRTADFAVVTIEHGLGTGVILNHRLFRGARGLGTELGHTKVELDGALCRCGQRGCLEAYVADYALAREAAAAMGTLADEAMQMPQLLERLFDEARVGNAAARSIFRRAGRYLAVGLANVINLFDPATIILSGERMRFDYLYAEDTLAEIQSFALKTGLPLPPVRVHEWGDLLWAHGAAALALGLVTETELGREAP